MITSRVALGSVSTLAVGALLIGVGPVLLRHAWGTSSATPWGALSSFSGNLSTSTPSDGDRSQLLKLAALKSGRNDTAAADPAMAAAAQLSVAQAPSPAPEAVAPPDPAPAEQSTAAEPMNAGQTVVAMADPASDAASATEAIPLPPSLPARNASALININRATSDALDHFPGAGRIGHAIVTHRPYRSIADLVRKRVLRTSDFQKIQGRISVD